jgi:hypothetical protein
MFKEYEITLTSGTYYLIAKDSESAAYTALDLSVERGDELIDVKLTPEW